MLMGCIPRCFNNSLMCVFVKHGQGGNSGRKYNISLIESLQVTYEYVWLDDKNFLSTEVYSQNLCNTQHRVWNSMKFSQIVTLFVLVCCALSVLWNLFWPGAETPKPWLKFGCPPSANFETPQPCGMFTSSSKVFELETAEYERHSISVYLSISRSWFRIHRRRWGQEEQCERWQVWMLSVWGLGPVTRLVVAGTRLHSVSACDFFFPATMVDEETNLVFHLMTDPWLHD